MAFRTAFISLTLACAIHADGFNTDDPDDRDCPEHWGGSSVNGGHIYCCFGMSVMENDEDGVSGYCCVYNTLLDYRNLTETACSTTVHVTEADYTSLVSAASKSIMAKASATQDEQSSSSVTHIAGPTATESAEGTDENAGSIIASNLMARFSSIIIAALLVVY